MFQKELVVHNETGLHARPASDLSNLCQQYESEITIISGEMEINPKSIISILSGGIYKGAKVLLQVEGIDEEAAGNAIAEFIENLKE